MSDITPGQLMVYGLAVAGSVLAIGSAVLILSLAYLAVLGVKVKRSAAPTGDEAVPARPDLSRVPKSERG